MNDTLTQEELDILLSGVDDGDFDSEVEADPLFIPNNKESGQIRSYDFNCREKRVPGSLPVLEMVNERIAKNVKHTLTGFLNILPDIEVSGIQMQPFSEYAQRLNFQAGLTVARVSQLRGRVLIAMDPRLVFALVDNYFGGVSPSNLQTDYSLSSPMVLRVVSLAVDLIFRDLKQAWKPVTEIDFEYVNSDINPKVVNIAHPSEVVVISSFRIRLQGGEGELNIAMPFFMVETIEEIVKNNRSSHPEHDSDWEMALQHQLLDVKIKVAGRLAEKTMTLNEIMHIKKGDILSFDMPGTVVLNVQGVPIFEGRAGVSDGHYAVKVVDKNG